MKALLLFIILNTALSETPCSLCLGVDQLKRPHTLVNSKGKTCAELMVNMFSLAEGPTCSKLKDEHYRRCCTSEPVDEILQESPANFVSTLPKGPYKKCELCYTKDYPFNTGMVINMLYIGVGSCAQYWEYGQSGWIPNHLCDPLQYFAYEPCGCGNFNPLIKS